MGGVEMDVESEKFFLRSFVVIGKREIWSYVEGVVRLRGLFLFCFIVGEIMVELYVDGNCLV